MLIRQGATLQFAASLHASKHKNISLFRTKRQGKACEIVCTMESSYRAPGGGGGGGRGQMCTNVLYTSYMITVEKVTDASYESDAAATASIKV